MADVRFPTAYLADRRFLKLTDAERSTFLMLALWEVANRTDGAIERADVEIIPGVSIASIDGLVRAGFLARTDSGWVDTTYLSVQTTRDEFERLERSRRADRERKARQRAHRAGDHSLCGDDCAVLHRKNPRDSPGDKSGDSTGKARLGQARPG